MSDLELLEFAELLLEKAEMNLDMSNDGAARVQVTRAKVFMEAAEMIHDAVRGDEE